MAAILSRVRWLKQILDWWVQFNTFLSIRHLCNTTSISHYYTYHPGLHCCRQFSYSHKGQENTHNSQTGSNLMVQMRTSILPDIFTIRRVDTSYIVMQFITPLNALCIQHLLFNGLVQEICNSNALAMEILQSGTKPSISSSLLAVPLISATIIFY